MAKITFRGLEAYERKLSQLGDMQEVRRIAGRAAYEGAKIITDEIRDNIHQMLAYDDEAGLYAYVLKNPAPFTRTAKQGLLDGLGIAPLSDDKGYLNVKIGFDGYNKLKTERFPKGQPNVLIARALESGSSVTEKRPFVRPAIQSKREEAERKMAQVVDEEIDKRMK